MTVLTSDYTRAAFAECRVAVDAPPAPAVPSWYGRRAEMAAPLTAVGLRCLAAYLAHLNPHHRGD